jgi:hypothetical protein
MRSSVQISGHLFHYFALVNFILFWAMLFYDEQFMRIALVGMLWNFGVTIWLKFRHRRFDLVK